MIEKKVTTNGSSSRHEHEHAFSEVSRPIVISPSVGTNLGSPVSLYSVTIRCKPF